MPDLKIKLWKKNFVYDLKFNIFSLLGASRGNNNKVSFKPLLYDFFSVLFYIYIEIKALHIFLSKYDSNSYLIVWRKKKKKMLHSMVLI